MNDKKLCHFHSPVTYDVADSGTHDYVPVKKEVDRLERQVALEVDQGREVELVVKPLKNRPKSKEFELFEKKSSVIGVVSLYFTLRFFSVSLSFHQLKDVGSAMQLTNL